MRSVARRVLVPGRSSIGDQMRGEMWRRLAALAVAIAPGVVAVPLVASWRGRLPANLATHWKIGAAPDEFTGRDGFLDGWVTFSLTAAALGVLATLLLRRGSRIAVTITGAAMGLLASLGLLIGLANLDRVDPETARLGWEAALPLPLMVGTAGLAWLIHGRAVEPVLVADEPPPSDLPRLPRGEPARYDRTEVQWWFAAGIFTALGALGAVIWAFVSPWLGAELVLLGLALGLFARSRVRVSEEHGLTLSGGFINHRIPIAEITGARPRARVEPFHEFGGWGLRYLPGTVALVQRSGPGVEVGRTGDRRVVVTAADPERLAAVVNTLADQRFAVSPS